MKRVGKRSARRHKSSSKEKKDKSNDNMLVEEYDEINFFNPSESNTVDYGEAKTFDFTDVDEVVTIHEEKSDEIVLDENTEVKVIITENIKTTIDVKGHQVEKIKRSSKKDVKKAKKGLSKLKYDPEKAYQDAKRNAKEYKMKCPTCHGTNKCPNCKGRGRIWIIRKCKVCGGSGVCRDCRKDNMVPCPGCQKPINYFASSCNSCGHTNYCPHCREPMPFGATRCISCETEFLCSGCKARMAPGYEEKCPKCDTVFKYDDSDREDVMDDFD